MIKKILWIILIILILYIVIIFVSPTVADEIGDSIGIKHFNETIRNLKGKADDIYTNLPTKEEWKDAYEKTLSGAENLKNEAVSGAYIIKDKVDDIRGNLNQTAEQYENLKNQINDTKDQIENGIDTIKGISNALSGALQDTSTGTIEN